MSQADEHVELVRGGLEDWIAGRRDAAMSNFTEDFEVFVPPELGNAGTYRGLKEYRRWLEAWEDAWSEFEMIVESVEAAGDGHVIATIRSRGTGIGSGIEVENMLAWVFGIRDRKMEYLSLQPDREHADALVREREAA